MKRALFWASLVVASLLVALYVTWLDSDFAGDLWVEVVPRVMGQVAAYVLLPAILVSSVVLIRKLFKRTTSSTATFILAGIFWAILALSSIRVSSFESTMRTSTLVEFAPIGCEYSVSFPGTPERYTMQKSTANGVLLPLYGAQLTVAGGAGQIRAECGSTMDADTSNFTDENFVLYMTEMAKDLGLSRTAFDVEDTSIGIRGTLIGTKDSERGRLTVQVINLIGESSIMTLYLMAYSEDFQTSEMPPFVKSVRKPR